jgi:methanogenic corrinoid protein MtbC1
MDNKAQLLKQFEDALLAYDAEASVKAAHAIVEGGLDIKEAIEVATAAISRVGDLFQTGEAFLPELMLAGDAMKQSMAVLSGALGAGAGGKKAGKAVLGAVAGDIHDIGKNLVGTYLALKGVEVIDLGVNVPPMDFVETAERERANLIALSALMTTSMPYQRDVINILKEMGLRDKYFVIVGGGPVTADFALEAGADGWAPNAIAAAKLCGRLLEGGARPPLAQAVIEE